MIRKGTSSNCSAFSLTDCLVLMATTACILVIPCLAASSNRERINRMVCLNNLRQMGVGSQLYAAEDPRGRLAGSLPSVIGSPTAYPGDDLNWLYGFGPSRTRFVQDINTFICPSAHNYVRTNTMQLPYSTVRVMVDLLDNAPSPSFPGHSYEVVSFWPGSPYINKTLQSTATYKKKREPLMGEMPGPAMILLMHDAMDVAVNQSLENYPNPFVAHGAEGGNMLFCDGHAEWIGTADWGYRWAVSQDTTVWVP